MGEWGHVQRHGYAGCICVAVWEEGSETHTGMCVLISGALIISMSRADTIMSPLLAQQQQQHENELAECLEEEKHKVALPTITFDPEWLKTM